MEKKKEQSDIEIPIFNFQDTIEIDSKLMDGLDEVYPIDLVALNTKMREEIDSKDIDVHQKKKDESQII